MPVIVHAGRGIPSLGRDSVDLARAYPSVPIILAHAAISDLAWIWREAAGQPNLYFDTAWWNTADQLALFALIPPGQILFASDTPYGRTVAAATIVLRVALAAGLSVEQIAGVAGGQLERLLAGATPLDLGPAPMTGAAAPGPLLERVHTLLVAAAARLTAGYPAEEYLQLARMACRLPPDHPDAAGRRVGARTAGPPRRLSLDESATAGSASSRHSPDLRRGRDRADARAAAPEDETLGRTRPDHSSVDEETETR